MVTHPKVSIIITAYLPQSKPYLDLCMRSIELLDYPKESTQVILVSPKAYSPAYEGTETISPIEPLNYSNAHAINLGVNKALESNPDYVLYANDDVIFTRHSVMNLVNMARRVPQCLLMPISNDQQGRYHLALPRSVAPGPYRIESLTEDKIDGMISSASFYEMGLVLYDTLCTYAMLFTPKLWRDVGGMDERFGKAGPDDIDFCIRARQMGYQPAISLDAIIWHAGGITADLTHTPEMREMNARMFDEKWGS